MTSHSLVGEDWGINIRRIGSAAEIVRHRGTAVCAYRATRNGVRNMVGPDRFAEVFVDTPLGVCEQGVIKGLYARARREEIKGFTGVDDPHQIPVEGTFDWTLSVARRADNTAHIVDYLRQLCILSER